jgi:hypothetical protein
MEKVNKNFSISSQCGKVTNHGSLSTEFLLIVNELKRLRERFYEDQIYGNLPEESWKIIFAKIENQEFFTQHGISSALAYLRFEALNYGSNPKIYSFKDLRTFFQECLEMSKCSSLIIKKNDEVTQQVISEKFSNFLSFLAIFIVISLLASWLFVIPFFKKDVKVVELIDENMKNYLNLSDLERER